MINFFVDPGLLLAKGDACLFIPLLGLVKAEKFARFWESVIGDNSEFSLRKADSSSKKGFFTVQWIVLAP
jgi:hypothetical protein